MSLEPAVVAFKVQFTSFQNGLRAFVTGYNGTFECTLGYWRAIAAEVRRTRPAQLLVVDVLDGGVPPPHQLLAFVQAMTAEDIRDLRIAYVEDKPESIGKVELAGIFAQERGFTVQVFDDEGQALRWLRYGGD
ncbi:MAG: hypothetical protein ABIO17_03115 [Pseudoxanthomonas sp.]